MHSRLVFWLNSYHVTVRNIAKNIVPAIRMGKIAPTCVDTANSTKRQTLYLPRTILDQDLQLEEEPC